MLRYVASISKRRGSLRGPGHSEARAVGLLLEGGAGLVALSLALPHPSGGDPTTLVVTAAAMAVVGALCIGFARRIPIAATHAILALTAVATGALIWAAGIATGQYGAIFVWAMLIAGCYFPPWVTAAHLSWVLGVYAVSLAVVESTARETA